MRQFLASAIPVGLLVLAALSLSEAQVPDPVVAASAPQAGSEHSYIGMGAETVTPADGQVTFDLPIRTPAGRGLSFPFGIRYNAAENWHLTIAPPGNTGTLQWTGQGGNGLNGWKYDVPALVAQELATQVWTTYTNPGGNSPTYTQHQCDGASNFVFRGLDGRQHTLNLAGGNWNDTAYESTNPEDCINQPYDYITTSNNHGIVASYPPGYTGWPLFPPVTVVDQSGTTYQFTDLGGTYAPISPNSPVGAGGYVQTITDRNGNQITASGNGYKDTLGRTVVSWTGLGNDGDQISVAGLPSNIVVHWSGSVGGANYPMGGYMLSGTTNCTVPTTGPAVGNAGITEIDYPNGQSYKIGYNSTYGTISSITFPDGGSVSYTWGLNRSGQTNASWWFNNGGSQTQESCAVVYDVPTITDRWVNDGQKNVLHQHFSYCTNGITGTCPTWKQTTVTNYDLVSGLTSVTVYGYGGVGPDVPPFNPTPTNVPVEYSVTDQDGSGNTLKTLYQEWWNVYSVTGSQTVLDNGQTTTELRCFDTNEQITKLYEYGFPSEGSYPGDPSSCLSPGPAQLPLSSNGLPAAKGPLRRETVTAYHLFFQGFSSGNMLGTHIVDEPNSTTVYDGSANQLKQTSLSYDLTAVLASGAQTGLVSPPGARGNITSVTQWLNTGNSPLTTYTYYDTGQIASRTDACGNLTCSDMTGSNHKTNFSYADSFTTGTAPGQTNAYLTNITDPMSHSASFTYGYADGARTSSTDANTQVTHYKYNTPPTGCSFPDGLDRLSEADFPDGGKTTYCYNDAEPSPSVTTSKLITSGTSITTTTTFDGVGHAVGTQVTDPDGPTFTATAYDGMGRKYTATNPYRSTSDSTYGTTTYTYDALGRTTAVAEPDGSSVLTSYSGNQTTVTDEVGSQRISITDGLGRLTEVEEPGTGSHGDTTASGAVTIGGSEQAPIPATQSTGSFMIHSQGPNSPAGTITLYVNGVTVASVTYASGASVGTVTQSLVSAINGNPSSPVTAIAQGGGLIAGIDITSIAYGSATDYPISGTPTTGNSMTVQASSSTMKGGANAIYDAGIVSIHIGPSGLGGFTSSAPYGNGSTPASIAAALYAGFSAPGSPVVASLSGSVISVTTIDAGSSSDFQLTATVGSQIPQFLLNPSFTATGSGTLTGGSNATFGSAPMVTLYTYDALNNLTCAVQKGTDTTAFTTCAAAKSSWRPRSFVYDSLSRLTSSTNPESNTAVTAGTLMPTTYTYDANSNLTSKTVPAQNQQSTATTPISYCYDVDNRLTAKSYSSSSSCASPVATYTYDQTASSCYNVGHRTGMTDAAGSEAWCHDKIGRVLTDQRTTNGLTKSATYTYLPYVDGSLNTVTYPSGRVVTYTTGAAERLLTASDSITSYASGVHYAPQGAIAALVNNTNLSSTEIYNNRLQPCWMYTTSGTALPTSSSCTGTATTGNFQDLKYNFSWGISNNGNVLGVTNNRDTTRSQVFAYDALNRLQSANTTSMYSTSSTHCWGESYGIDGWGNLQALAMLNSQYTGCNQESGFSVTASVQNQLPITGNRYDSAGNLWVGMVGGIPYTYTYNAENQMTSVTGLSTTTNYLYDGDGKRVEKTGSKIYWYGPDGSVLDETDPTGSFTNANFSEYIYFGGERIARRDSSGDVFYYFADHLGTSRTMAQVLSGQTTGSLCYDADFYPFGGERAYTNICTQNYKFTGKERDAESGLDMFGARYYGSSLGRFMTPDWAAKPVTVPYAHFGNPQSLNLYSYVVNNPTTTADPDGHCIPFCAITTAIANWVSNGIIRDGSVGAFAKNNGIGLAKGAGQVGVGLAAGLADKAVPGSAIQLSFTKTGQNAINAVTPSNQTQAEAAPVGAAIATTAVTMGVTAGVGALEGAASEGEVLTEGTIFRSGGTNPGNLTGEDLSFRDSLSNPIGSGENPVFEPGDKYFGADVSKLPEGSAVLDNNPAGHVSVNAPAQDIKNAIVVKGKLPNQ